MSAPLTILPALQRDPLEPDLNNSSVEDQRPEWVPPKSERHVITGVAAGTGSMPSRTFTLAREALEGMVRDFQPHPMRLQHDNRIGTVTKVWLEDKPNGVTELWFEGEVWVPHGVDPASYIPTGMSIGFAERTEQSERALAVISAESTAFDDATLAQAAQALAEAPVEIAVTRYHQLAEVPPAVIIIALKDAALPLVYGVVSHAIYDSLKSAVKRLLQGNHRPNREARLTMRIENVAEVDLQIPMDVNESVAAIDKFFEGAAKLITATDRSERRTD